MIALIIHQPSAISVEVALVCRLYLCDAMLARCQLWPGVCLSVTSRCYVEASGRIKLVFGIKE